MNSLRKHIKFDLKYALNGGSWLMFGYIFTITGVLCTSYAFANFLSPAVYGQYKYLLSVAAVLSTFSLTGIGLAITQGVAKKIPGFFQYATALGLRFGLIVSTLALVGATYYFIQGDTTLAIGLAIIALLQPLFDNSNLIFAYMQGKELFKLNTKAHIAKTMVSVTSLVAFTLWFENAIILLCTYFLSNIVANYTIRLLVKPENEINTRDSETLKLISFAKHTSLRGILSAVAAQFDKILIFQNMSAVDLAIYSFAIALPEQFKSVSKSIYLMVIPRFSNHNTESIKSTMLYKTLVYSGFMLMAVSAYILAAPYIYQILFPTYTDSIFYSQLFALGNLFLVSGLPLAALNAKTQTKILYKLEIGVSIFQLAAILVLFLYLGILGVIWGRILGRMFHAVSSYYFFYKFND